MITKTDLAKVENCFALLPDVACKGAEKSFTEFAERITKEWDDENKRIQFGDDWFRSAVARVILFRTAEKLVSEALWYAGGYRAQIVAYTVARLAHLAETPVEGARLDYLRIWSAQAPGNLLEQQMREIGEVMADVLRNPPLAGRNISEWAKQQACRKRALETEVTKLRGFDSLLLAAEEAKSARKAAKAEGKVDRGLEAVSEVIRLGTTFWRSTGQYARGKKLLWPDDEKALLPAINMPKMIPTDRQAEQLIRLLERCREAGFEE
jgi:hypothetical protein